MTENIDEIYSDVKEIRKIVEDKLVMLADRMENPGPFDSVVLSSSNLAVTLNPSYSYDIAFNLVGASTASTAALTQVQVQYVSDTTPNPGRLYMSSTNWKYNLKGVKVNKISVDSTSIGSGSLIVAYLGSKQVQSYDIKS
jgi:hypothetical protein